MAADDDTKGLSDVIGRALTDKDERDKLFADPDLVAKQYGLSAKDTESLKKLDKAKFEDAANRLAARSDLTIKVVISKSF